MQHAAEQLNVAFVGCGRIADVHQPGYVDHPHARLHAICDTSAETLERRKAEWGVEQTYADFDELLADPKVDAVEILTPQPLHEPMTLAALRAGKHVALQKPMANDLASADRMIAAAQQAGRVFKITENYVFYPPIVRARELIREGAIGEPTALRIQFIGAPEGGWEVPAAAWEWRVAEARAGRGFATFDHGHHLWSTAWFLLGSPDRVSGWIESADGIIDCPAQFQWTYADRQALGSCSFVQATQMRVPSRYYSNDEWIEVFGSRGILQIRRCTGNLKDGPVLVLHDGNEARAIDDLDSDWGAGFVGATHDFVRAIREGTEACLTGAQGREVLRFSLALQKAARLRREVYVEELDRKLPGWYASRRKRRELAAGRPGLLERLGIGPDLKKLAPRAVELTRELVAGFEPGADEVPDTSIGLILRGDDQPEQKLGLVVRDNVAELLEGQLPDDARLTVTMRPGVWAAILLRKKRIEMAVLQGHISFTGQADEALNLKTAFKF